jgi:hypothetical protein
MPIEFVEDPQHWRKRAEEARSLAAQVIDDTARKRLTELAKEFERIVWRLEGRADKTKGWAFWRSRSGLTDEQRPPLYRRMKCGTVPTPVLSRGIAWWLLAPQHEGKASG